MIESSSLFEWRDVFLEYVGFLGSFAMLGALGFRYGILRSPRGASGGGAASLTGPSSPAARSAAAVGLAGVVLSAASFVEHVVSRAESKHLALDEALLTGGAPGIAQTVLLPAMLVGFVLGWRRISVGWPIAATAGIAFALRNVLSGKLWGMVNPLHVLGASLWLGTLFVLVVCGIGQALQLSVPAAEREAAVAEMVSRFSKLALGSAGLLGVTGLITSWKHLKPFAALWTTPYGYALIAKLSVVAFVFGLGAWNWRRVGPSLGTEGGAVKIRRTASIELAVAAVVLVLTAILVSLPSPKLPGH